MNPLSNAVTRAHPNATVSLISGLGLGTIVVYAFQHWLGVKLSTQDGIYISGALGSIALFIGHNGAVGTWNVVKNLVLHGTGGKPKAATHKKTKPKP